MSIFKFLTDIFDSIFRSSSPEVQKRLRLKKIDSDMRALPNGIYRNGLVQPNFAEVLRVLYFNTRPIARILENTIAGPDLKRNTRFEFQLITACYSAENQKKLKNLEYENRKNDAMLADLEYRNLSRTFDEQRRELEKLIHELNTKEIFKIDQVFIKLNQLNELCKFNFITPLKTFDPRFNPDANPNDKNAKPAFSAVAPISIENVLLDLYFIIADFKMTMAVADAVIALANISHNEPLSKEQQTKIITNLKKIEYACNKIFTAESLKSLIQLSKQNPDFEPQKASYSANSRQRYAQYLQEQFSSDESRIKRELKDNKIQTELKQLFDGKDLLKLTGYNDDTNAFLIANASDVFTWITPIRVLKTFIETYFTDSIKSLLNDIVIEGFFNNQNYKTQFSQTVFTTNEIKEQLTAFEDSFKPKAVNDEEILKSYIRDSHKDVSFTKKLNSHVEKINADAKQLIQTHVSALFALYKEIGDLLQDARKPSCEIISNLKVLMMSSRNRDNTDFLENNYEKWQVFFEIMKNYAIITTVEKK